MRLLCCRFWCVSVKKNPPSNMCQLGFRMDDLVDYLLSVIISKTKSHKNCCWHQRRMHLDTHLQGFIKSCKHSQSYASSNWMRHKNSLRQQYKCTCDLWHVEHVCWLFTSSTGTPLILLYSKLIMKEWAERAPRGIMQNSFYSVTVWLQLHRKVSTWHIKYQKWGS